MDGAFGWRYLHWQAGAATLLDAAVVEERLVRIHVNGEELATFMATPVDLDLLALGFLRAEQIIGGRQDVRLLHVCPSRSCVEVWLRQADVARPRVAIVTAGCGGGITFDDLSQRAPRLESPVRVTAAQVLDGMRQLLVRANLYQVTRGVHTSALSDGTRLVAHAEDVGRHNTVDKLWGYCLQHDIDPADHVLLATGRISSEMLNKAAKMRVPVVVSRTSPTSLSVRLAEEWDILLIGYARRGSFNVYAGSWRLEV